MKRLSLIFALVVLLAGCAVGPTATPSYGQGYGGYNYPPPPQNPYANPWVGNNTPWTYYQGDWFLNGILQQFFGNQYGWAPYYAYPPTYIVRPQVWYAPQWNAWYQRNPHYWQTFEQKYPYWRGHRVGQRYDENFYNKYHRGQGEGWNKGFHGVRPATPTGPYIRSTGPTSPGVRPGQPTGPGVRPAQPAGPSWPSATPTGPYIRSTGPTSPGERPGQPTGPQCVRLSPLARSSSGSAHRSRSASGPAHRPQRASGSAHRPERPSGSAYRSERASGSAHRNWRPSPCSPCPWRA